MKQLILMEIIGDGSKYYSGEIKENEVAKIIVSSDNSTKETLADGLAARDR